MSVITSRASTVLSILKTEKRLSSNRVRFKLPSNVRKIFMDTKNGVSRREYEELVCTIRDSEISDDDLVKLLEEAKNCISLLDYDMRLFVQALVILGWTNRSPKLVQHYQEFMINLVSAHSQHAKVVIEQLVKLFLDVEDAYWLDGRPSEAEESRLDNYHVILKSIVRTIPMTQDMLLSSIKLFYPHYSRSCCQQLSFLYNTMKVIEYLPHCRREILEIVFDRMLNLDVNSPREDILGYSQELFTVDEYTIADSLDFGMMMILRFIEKTCKPADVLRMPDAKSLYLDFMEIFERCLLSTCGSHHVQFLLFYICSLHSSLMRSFLNTLLKKVLTPGTATVVRKASVAYMASFLSRGNFLPIGYLKTYLSELTNWANRYIGNQDANTSGDILNHGVFFSVCQAIFYVIAFRHKDLVDSRKKLVFLQSLNLSKLVNCRLNPLRACSFAVVENFAAVARDYQLVYCYTIIENNERGFLDQQQVEAFFPFDPYVLKRSSKYIQPLYRDYCPEADENDEDVENEGEDENFDRNKQNRSLEEEDDFISDARRLDKSIDFNFSTSPGFKLMSI